MAITHMQNKKMPRGTSGKVTIKENCSQKTQRGLQAQLAAVAGPGASSLQSNSAACLS